MQLRLEDECIHMWIQSGGSTTVSISGVKIEKGLEAYYANVLMFYLEGDKKKPLDFLWQLWQNTDTETGVFVLVLCISLVVLKRYPLYKTILCSVWWEPCHMAAFLTVMYRSLFWVLSALRHLQRLPQRSFWISKVFRWVRLMRSHLGGSAER